MARNAKGQFICGPDSDRKLFTSETAVQAGRKGWRAAIIKHERTLIGRWLRERVKLHYYEVNRRNRKKNA